jgi:SMC interacting uncharacterized protein involved in chromosome segregation
LFTPRGFRYPIKKVPMARKKSSKSINSAWKSYLHKVANEARTLKEKADKIQPRLSKAALKPKEVRKSLEERERLKKNR